MVKASVSKSYNSQAVRLPKSIALPDGVKPVDVVAVGNSKIITPAGSGWAEWFDCAQVSDDFMVERNQRAGQFRKSLT